MTKFVLFQNGGHKTSFRSAKIVTWPNFEEKIKPFPKGIFQWNLVEIRRLWIHLHCWNKMSKLLLLGDFRGKSIFLAPPKMLIYSSFKLHGLTLLQKGLKMGSNDCIQMSKPPSFRGLGPRPHANLPFVRASKGGCNLRFRFGSPDPEPATSNWLATCLQWGATHQLIVLCKIREV